MVQHMPSVYKALDSIPRERGTGREDRKRVRGEREEREKKVERGERCHELGVKKAWPFAVKSSSDEK